MSNLDFVKDAISKLPREERRALSAWLNAQSMDDWDREMVRDLSPGGAGRKFVEEIERDLASGGIEELSEGFARRNRARS